MAISFIPGSGISVSPTASSVNGTLPAPGIAASALFVYNAGPSAVAVRAGHGAQTAVSSDFVIGSNNGQLIQKAQGVEGVAAICVGGGSASTVYFSGVDGLSATDIANLGTTTPLVVPLSGNYTLSSADDGTTFYATTAINVTIPTGLSPMPSVLFIPPAAGSITLIPATGVILAGGTSNIAVNMSTNPAGAGLVPLYGQTDNYGIAQSNPGSSAAPWSGLTGAPTDNTAFNTWVAANVPAVDPTGVKKSAAYTLAASDHHGNVWLAAQAGDKTFTIPAGLPANFKCCIGYSNTTAAAGRLILNLASGVNVNWYTQQPESTSYVQSVYTASTHTVNTNIFMGKASANSQAWGWLVAEGANADTYTFVGQVGTFTTT
jgi:hypothetical protein